MRYTFLQLPADLKPFLYFLNTWRGTAIPSERAARELTSTVILADPSRALIELAVLRWRERVRDSLVLFAPRCVNSLLKHTAGEGLNPRQSFKAWVEVWRFLHESHPTLRDRLGQCEWCGRIFIRYHRSDRYCDAVCRLAPTLLKHEHSYVAEKLAEDLPFLRRLRAEERKASTPARKTVTFFLRPIFGRLENGFRFPQDVSDDQAFRVVWQFLFRGAPRNTKRLDKCKACHRLYFRHDLRMKHHSGSCRVRYWRAVRQPLRPGNDNKPGVKKVRKK